MDTGLGFKFELYRVSRFGGGVIRRGFLEKPHAGQWAYDNGYLPFGASYRRKEGA